MSTHIDAGTPTQVAHPWRAVLRTLVAWVVGLAVAALARWVGIDLTELAQPMIDSITVGAWALVTGAIQWVLTRRGVEEWLRKFVPRLATGVHVEG